MWTDVFLGAEHTPSRRKEKRRVLSAENQANTHSSSERHTQTVYCHVFSTSIEQNARNKTLLKAVFGLDPHFRVAFVQTKHTLIAAKPSKTGRKTDEVVKGIIGGKAAEPSLMIQVETGKGKINRAANWICKKVCLALFFLTTMLLSFF